MNEVPDGGSNRWQDYLLRGTVVGTVIAVIVVVNYFVLENPLAEDTFLTVLTVVVAATATFFGAAFKEQAVSQEAAEQQATQQSLAAYERILEDSEPSLGNLLQANKTELEKYHVQTRGQAQRSFMMSSLAMTVGLVVLVGGAYAALRLTDEPAAQTIVGSLTAIGTIVSGYIGRTFIRAHERALIQLNLYFQQPVVASYLLTAERLVSKASAQQKDALIENIALRCLEVAGAVSADAIKFLDLDRPRGRRSSSVS
jgi:hypothetical protein